VSLSAEGGKITCLLGRNGVGKSSLLRAVMGIHPISRGQIVWEGQPLGRLAPHQRAARGIGYVPQGREIFALLTVRENLETGYAVVARGDRNVPAYVFELFPVLKSMLRRRGGTSPAASSSSWRSVAPVARPRLLVLDEPTEGISRRSSRTSAGRSCSEGEARAGDPLVEQYLDCARARRYRGDHGSRPIVFAGPEHLDKQDVRRHLTV
jgi:urea transport system ATP-binding protein